MFSTRRQQALLLLGLVSLSAALGWHLRLLWKEYQKRTAWVYAGPTKPVSPNAAVPAGAPATQSFSDIVARDLFRPERSSAPAGGAQAPEMPYLRGTMSLGSGWFALMAPGNQPAGPYKRVVPGEEIGGYKLAAVTGSEVVLEWGEKKYTLEVAESVRRAPHSAERTPMASVAPATQPRGSAASAARVTTVAPAPTSNPARAAEEEERRKHTAAGYNAPPGAPVDAPDGFVFGGKKKVINRTPFGNQIWWVDVQLTPAAPKEQPSKQPEKKEP